MTVFEILELKKKNEIVRWALLEDAKRKIWKFLREEVHASCNYGPCGRCGDDRGHKVFRSPYNNHWPGWCIFCILSGYLNNMPRWDDPYQIEGYYPNFFGSTYAWAIYEEHPLTTSHTDPM